MYSVNGKPLVVLLMRVIVDIEGLVVLSIIALFKRAVIFPNIPHLIDRHMKNHINYL
jgi:hypothetical protein